MNAKELIEAAKDVQAASHPIVFVQRSMGAIANHILATVREDDDEPVTRERLEADGWELGDHDHFRKSGRRVLFFESSAEMQEPQVVLLSMGHLRRLVAALGK